MPRPEGRGGRGSLHSKNGKKLQQPSLMKRENKEIKYEHKKIKDEHKEMTDEHKEMKEVLDELREMIECPVCLLVPR